MDDKVIPISMIRQSNEDKERCLKQLHSIPFYIKPNGEVLTKDEHIERRKKREQIEQAAKDRL